MGAFFVLRNAAPSRPDPALLEKLRDHFRAAGFAPPFEVTTADRHVAVYPKLNGTDPHVHRVDDRNFAFATGTLIYRGATGAAALARIWTDEEGGTLDRTRLRGAYALGICRGGSLTLSIDAMGTYKVYRDAAWTTVSSAFLATLAGVPRPVADLQGIYEYVFQAATYGGRTLAQGISLLDPRAAVRLDHGGTLLPLAPPAPPSGGANSFAAHLEQSVAALREWFGEIVTCFGDRIDTALSGGYDSRLILALLRDRGAEARLHVYGAKDDDDVRIARAIADGEGLRLEHVDKSARPRPADSMSEIIARNCRLLDAYPVDGIMDDGTDVATRRERASGGALALNGGGGEIFRNFFYLPDRPFSIREVIWTFYSQFDPATATPLFSERKYVEAMVSAVAFALGVSSDTLMRDEVERVYPAFRCRYWTGRNTSVNNQFGAALTPFIEHGIVDGAAAVPIRFKDHGRFEAALIHALSPRLARYPSSYGHGFGGPVPFKRRMKDQLTLLRPPLLRRYAFRIKARLQGGRIASSPFQMAVDPAFPLMSRYFRMDRIGDAGQFGRICTLEHLLTRQGIATSDRI
jgi:asparagine synthase (glutamine-hydrolysing)